MFRSAPLLRTWLCLLALSAATTILTLLSLPHATTGGLILLLAVLKSRLILSRYLALAQVPGWRQGITVVVTGFALLIFGLWMV